MSCLIKIRSSREQMSANDKKIADYLLSNSALLRDYSSQQLASAVGVSQSSIVKFCQKLGYKGYPDLKLAINADVVMNNKAERTTRPHFEHQQLNQISDNLLKGKLEAVTATIQLNQEQPFIEAMDLLKGAQRVFVYTGSNSRFLADYLVYQLLCLGKVVFHSNEPLYKEQFMASMEASDVVLVLADDAEADGLYKRLAQLKSQRISIVFIGRFNGARRRPYDVCIQTVADNTSDRFNASAYSRAAQQHVIDILLKLLASENQEHLDPD